MPAAHTLFQVKSLALIARHYSGLHSRPRSVPELKMDRTSVFAFVGEEAPKGCVGDYGLTTDPRHSNLPPAQPRGPLVHRLRILKFREAQEIPMGLSQFSHIFADEPGSWESRGGALLSAGIDRLTRCKRPNQRIVIIGTRRAPVHLRLHSWWLRTS